MQFDYETDRLILRVCGEDYTTQLLAFQNENRSFFAPWEPKRRDAFYTPEFQAQVLLTELQAALKGTYIRYYLFLKNAPVRIIGTVSFSHISHGEDRSCHVGYKLDHAHTGYGYAREALQLLLAELHNTIHIHRVEADIMPKNHPSLRLVERLGFLYEGIARSSHEINGHWEDHLRYALIFPEE